MSYRVLPVCQAALLLTLLIIASACSPAPETPAEPQSKDPAGDAAKARGEAIVSGKAPAASGGLPSILILEPKEPREFPEQTTAPVMDQISLTFTPAVMFVRTGQPADFRNSDEVLHNIRVRNDETKESAFNIALPTGGSFTYAFQSDGFYDVGCDIHPAMNAVVIASESPYATLAEPDGTFAIEHVPPGAYTLTIYYDVTRLDRSIDVVAGRTDLGEITP